MKHGNKVRMIFLSRIIYILVMAAFLCACHTNKKQARLHIDAVSYNIHVVGHARLWVAVIASIAPAKRNRFETGSLSQKHLTNETEEIENQSTISGDAVAISADLLRNLPAANADPFHSDIIAASQRLDLGIGILENRNHISNAGDLMIGGALDDDGQALGFAQAALNTGTITSDGALLSGHRVGIDILGNVRVIGAEILANEALTLGLGGYDIHVAGHTHLTGAAIASLATPERNRFESASLSWEHLTNEAEYKARSFGVSGGGGIGSGGGSFSPSIAPPQHEKARSTTEAAIANGTLIVHDGSGTDIQRGVTELQQDGLKEIFDQRKVNENMELGQLAGEMATQLIDDYFNARLREAQEPCARTD